MLQSPTFKSIIIQAEATPYLFQGKAIILLDMKFLQIHTYLQSTNIGNLSSDIHS